MITKFYIFEKLNVEDVQINVETPDKRALDSLIDGLSIVIQKRIKRNLRIISVSGSMNTHKLSGMEKTHETKLDIKMSNKDKLSLIYTWYDSINDIPKGELIVKINDKIIYNIKKHSLTPVVWIEKTIEEYKKYLKGNKWKIN